MNHEIPATETHQRDWDRWDAITTIDDQGGYDDDDLVAVYLRVIAEHQIRQTHALERVATGLWGICAAINQHPGGKR